MSSPSVPDPYVGLGVPKDATAQQIKTTYRKLALKYHPDKVQDESLKAAAADNFHRIQTAYEILGDDERRSRYDASIRLAQLRREVLEKQTSTRSHHTPTSPHTQPDIRTAAFEVPTQTPGRSAFTARGPERYAEERRPKSYDEDDYFGSRVPSRKYAAEYERERERESRKYSARAEPEKTKVYPSEKENLKAARTEKKKTTTKERTRDRETRERDREPRRPLVEDDSDDTSLEDFMPRSSRRRQEERERDSYPKRQKEHSFYDVQDDYDITNKIDFAREHMMQKGRTDEVRQPSERTKSDPYIERIRPSLSGGRRSSTRTTSSSYDKQRPERERKYSLQDDYNDDVPSSSTRRHANVPPLEKHKSSPADIKLAQSARQEPRRSTYDVKNVTPEFVAPPLLRRTETAPPASGGSNRSREKFVPPTSKLRTTDTNYGIPTPSTTPSPDEEDYSPKLKQSQFPSSSKRGGRYESESARTAPRRMTRSPSPINERFAPAATTTTTSDRKTRSGSSRYDTLPPLQTRTSSFQSFAIPQQTSSPVEVSPTRPNPLYGEIPSQSRRTTYKFSPETPSREFAREPARERESPRDSGRERDRTRSDRDRADKYKYVDVEEPKYSMKTGRDVRGSKSRSSRPGMSRTMSSAQ